MKRLVWLLIFVFGTALAQVSPVDLGSQQGKTCSCCEKPGACGNRDCGLPPGASAPAQVLAEQPQTSVSTAVRKRAARLYRVAINYLQTPEWRAPRRHLSAPDLVGVERVPLFKAQCSFLI